jgi:hypothetical protein
MSDSGSAISRLMKVGDSLAKLLNPLRTVCLWFCLVLLLPAAISAAVAASESEVVGASSKEPSVQLWFFWSRGCPHCLDARPWVHELARNTPWLELHDRELTGDSANARAYVGMAAALGREAQYVPAFLFCEQMLVGWDSPRGIGEEVVEQLTACRERRAGSAAATTTEPARTVIDLPWIGRLESGDLSLPVLTLVMAGLDAFNPCAFFVLLLLLSLLVHLRNRRRMLLIGGLYVLVSGVMYFAFMAAWLNVFLVVGNIAWVTMAAGLLALLIGLINIKDYFAFRRGVSLTIAEPHKVEIFRRGRTVLAAGSLPAMAGATVFLAFVANLYELLCTAGFPMVYTRLLTLQVTEPGRQYLWLALYNLIYVLPLLVIVVVVVWKMGSGRVSERGGRLLKLLSGSMMLALGVVLLAAPALLGSVTVAVGLLALALAVTWAGDRLARR